MPKTLLKQLKLEISRVNKKAAKHLNKASGKFRYLSFIILSIISFTSSKK